MYSYLQENNYSAIVSSYNPFLPALAASFNMLYYVYDYNFSLILSNALEQVSTSTLQYESSLLNKYVRISFAYYNLYQVAFQLIFNVQNDPILADFNSPLVFIICDSAECKCYYKQQNWIQRCKTSRTIGHMTGVTKVDDDVIDDLHWVGISKNRFHYQIQRVDKWGSRGIQPFRSTCSIVETNELRSKEEIISKKLWIFEWTDAEPAIAATIGKAIMPVVLSIDDYVLSGVFSNNCNASITCEYTSCAEACSLYNMALTIRRSVNTMSTTATVLVILKQETQKKYLLSIAVTAIRLGLLSYEFLWIITELVSTNHASQK